MNDNDNKYGSYLETANIFAKAVPIFIGIVYLLGFLVTNSYLSLYGIQKYDLLRSRYMFSGSVITIVLFIFYWMVASRVFNYSDKINMVSHIGEGKRYYFLWILLTSVYTAFDLIFGILLSVSLIGITLLNIQLTPTVYLIITAYFTCSVFSIKHKDKTIFNVIMNLLFQMLTTYFLTQLFINPKNIVLLFLSCFAALFAFFIFIVSIKYPRKRNFHDWELPDFIWMFVITTTFSVFFGMFILGKADTKYGGNTIVRAQLILDDNISEKISRWIATENDITQEIEIVLDDNDYIYVLNKGSERNQTAVIRIKKDNILGIKNVIDEKNESILVFNKNGLRMEKENQYKKTKKPEN